MPEIDLSGQVALVTGGGRGMGRTHSLELARRGARVVVNDLAPADGAESVTRTVVAEIEAGGGTAIAIEGSVAGRIGAESIVGQALDAYGRIDILINNAGIVRPSAFEDMPDEAIDSVIEVNLLGMIYATRAAYRYMKTAGYGRVVNIGSQVGVLGMHGGMVNYGATKGGALGVTVNLAHETEHLDINVNLVMPSAATAITAKNKIRGNDVETRGPAYYKQRFADRFAPEVSTALVTYLVSPGSRVSGEAFSVLGGRFSRLAIAVSRGWMSADGQLPTAEDIGTHLEQIRSLDDLDFPRSMQEAYDFLGDLLADDPAIPNS